MAKHKPKERKMDLQLSMPPLGICTTHDTYRERLADFRYQLVQNDLVLPARTRNAKLLLSNNKSDNDSAKAAFQGADTGGTVKPATGRFLDTTPNQKSCDDPAQLQGGASCVRNFGPDLADATWAHREHEGHHRAWNGHNKGRTIPYHSSCYRLEESAEETACAIGKTNNRPRHPVRARSGHDVALSGELVQDHLRHDQYAGLHLSFRSAHLHHAGGPQPVKGQRVTEGRAGNGGSPRPQHDRAIYSRGSHSPAPTRQPNLTFLSVN